jgi:hypothetical protein
MEDNSKEEKKRKRSLNALKLSKVVLTLSW